MLDDDFWMDQAIILAKQAESESRRPFGCVIVRIEDEGVVARTRGSELPDDPTNHSELMAIRWACHATGGLLQGYALYSTHEPCLMCCGAIIHSKISRVVYGSTREDLPMLFRRRTREAWQILLDTSVPPDVRPKVRHKACIDLFQDEVNAAVGVGVAVPERES